MAATTVTPMPMAKDLVKFQPGDMEVFNRQMQCGSYAAEVGEDQRVARRRRAMSASHICCFSRLTECSVSLS